MKFFSCKNSGKIVVSFWLKLTKFLNFNIKPENLQKYWQRK